MSEQQIILELLQKLNKYKFDNLADISNGINFYRHYSEVKKMVDQYLDGLSDDIGYKRETIPTLILSHVFMIDTNLSYEKCGEDEKYRCIILEDVLIGNRLLYEIDDYSLQDLFDDKTLSPYSLDALLSASAHVYDIRFSTDIEGGNFIHDIISKQVKRVPDLYITKVSSIDWYIHNPDDELEDRDHLDSSYDDDDDDDSISEVEMRWSDAERMFHEDFYLKFLKVFKEENTMNIKNGLKFDSLYEEYLIAYRTIEDRYQPYDKKCRTNELDVFVMFCTDVLHLDFFLNDLNAFLSPMIKLSSIDGYLVHDSLNIVSKKGLESYGETTLENEYKNIARVSRIDGYGLYSAIKEIYNLRGLNVH